MALSKADMLKFAEYQRLMTEAPAATPAPAVQHVTAPPAAQVVQATAPTGSALAVTIAGQSLATSELRRFKLTDKARAEGKTEGSLGWNLTGKVVIDGKRVQVSGNFVIIETKPS